MDFICVSFRISMCRHMYIYFTELLADCGGKPKSKMAAEAKMQMVKLKTMALLLPLYILPGITKGSNTLYQVVQKR